MEDDTPHSTWLSHSRPSLAKQARCDGEIFSLICTWVKRPRCVFRKGSVPCLALRGAPQWHCPFPPGFRASERGVSPMWGAQPHTPRVCEREPFHIRDSRRCDRSGAGGSRASSALCGAAPCAGAVFPVREPIPVRELPWLCGVSPKSRVPPGRTLRSSRALLPHCAPAVPRPFGSLPPFPSGPGLTRVCPLASREAHGQLAPALGPGDPCRAVLRVPGAADHLPRLQRPPEVRAAPAVGSAAPALRHPRGFCLQ